MQNWTTSVVARGIAWVVVVLLAAEAARAFIDFDGGPASENKAFTYSKELLYRSGGAPLGFHAIGEFDTGTDLLTRASIGEARWLSLEGPIWIRYDINEHLVFRGVAPRLFSSLPTPGALTPFRELIPAGLVAWNAATFSQDGFLVFEFELPADSNVHLVNDTPTVDLDLRRVLATSGEGDGVLRVRAFKDGSDAVRGENAYGLDKSQVVVPVAPSVRIAPRFVSQRAKATSGFLQFAAGARVPLAGFEVSIEADHRQPNGELVGTELEDLNVDVERSGLSFFGPGGFAFAPVKDGWTVEQLHARSGLCHGDAAAAEGDPDADPPQAPDPSRAVHPVRFGADDVEYPGGSPTIPLMLGTWYLCATLPVDNAEIIPEGDYYLTVALAPRRLRPFPPEGVEDALVGTVSRDGTTVHVPYLATSKAHAHELIVVNRHRRLVDYVLIVLPGAGGAASPKVIPGKLARNGPTRLRIRDITSLTGTEYGSAMLAVASFPNMIDVATTLVDPTDGSTDTVVLHRGLHDPRGAAPPPNTDPNRTTVHLPLVTTAATTVQRLTIVNRLFRAVSYVLTLHPEGDTTASPEVVRGTIVARAPTTLRIRDLTTLTGGDRAAGTLVLAAKPAYVEVSTTLVNRLDGATDTVILHRGLHDR